MNKKLEFLKNEFANCDKIKIFEVAVIDKRTNEKDWVVFDISIQGRTMYAQHVALTNKEEKSKKIAFKKLVIDPDFPLDLHLQDLYEICIEAIIDSDFYELTEND